MLAVGVGPVPVKDLYRKGRDYDSDCCAAPCRAGETTAGVDESEEGSVGYNTAHCARRAFE